MPHPDYRFQTHICVASPGSEAVPETAAGPEGECTSKAQTTLAYAIADVNVWAERLHGPEAGFEDTLDHHVLLTSPTAKQMLDAIADAVELLDTHFDESWGGSINLVYSGHGTSTGAFVLADRNLEPGELIEALAAGRAGDDDKTRHLRLVLDCCHAGRTLAELITHENHWSKYIVRDGFAACLPGQAAYELRSLGHSVLTHSMLRPGRTIWTRGLEKLTPDEIAEVGASERESTQYLTNGRQHALDVINGHAVGLMRGSRRSLRQGEYRTADELAEALDELGRKPRPAGSVGH